MATSILVVGEVEEGRLAKITAEMLGAARRLSGDGTVVCALIGSGVEASRQAAIALGADEVLIVDDAALAEYNTDTYLHAMLKVIEQASPAIALFGQSNLGRDLAPRVAFRLNTGVIMDCVELAMDGDRMQGTRPCYGGNARAVNVVRGDPQIATVRVKALDAPAASGSAEVVKQDADVSADQVRTTITGRTKPESTGIRLEDATVVVSGGRGLGGPEAFQQLEELAGVLGGAVGASRAVCDLGWYPVAAQVGLTGKMVTPDLYIAIGISGASQHMAGISSVKNIASVNKDADASIFKASRWAVVHDWKEFVPAFLEEVKKVKAG